ncbi:MAG: hypothetical protein IKZ53_06945 [Selenomonadaceae bacterium]|nr:hypothetical protein [Selenomonadaceae bacterium]
MDEESQITDSTNKKSPVKKFLAGVFVCRKVNLRGEKILTITYKKFFKGKVLWKTKFSLSVMLSSIFPLMTDKIFTATAI